MVFIYSVHLPQELRTSKNTHTQGNLFLKKFEILTDEFLGMLVCCIVGGTKTQGSNTLII